MNAQSTAKPDFASYWNQAGGQAWADLQDLMDRLNQPIAEVLIDRAFPGEGGAVLDVGCGAGATTLAMAERLGPQGRCVGLDISEPLLASARRRADELGLATASLVQGDAQTYELEQGAFDAIMSRFGVMFFSDFDAAFANLRGTLKPGGRITFACWRSPQDNPLAQVPAKAAAPFLPPLPEPDLDAPGRWAFADPERVRGILSRSGWRDIAIEPLDAPTPLSLDDAMTLNLRMGALGAALKEQNDQVREKVRTAVAESLQPHVEDGLVRMTAACWLVTARA
jgi:SAM-dependent methyltransferase